MFFVCLWLSSYWFVLPVAVLIVICVCSLFCVSSWLCMYEFVSPVAVMLVFCVVFREFAVVLKILCHMWQ